MWGVCLAVRFPVSSVCQCWWVLCKVWSCNAGLFMCCRLRGESQIVHLCGLCLHIEGWYALRQCDAMGEVTSLKVELPRSLSLSLSVQYTHKPRAPCQRQREREREVERGSERATNWGGWFDGCRAGSRGGSNRRAGAITVWGRYYSH